jgi:hypothetical protein
LAQSRALDLGPKEIHVAHVIIERLIDAAFVQKSFAQRLAEIGADGILNPVTLPMRIGGYINSHAMRGPLN